MTGEARQGSAQNGRPFSWAAFIFGLLLCPTYNFAVALPIKDGHPERVPMGVNSDYSIVRVEITAETLIDSDDCASLDGAGVCDQRIFLEYRGPDYSSKPLDDPSLAALPKQIQWFIHHVSTNPYTKSQLCVNEKPDLLEFLQRAKEENRPSGHVVIKPIPSNLTNCFTLPSVDLPATKIIGVLYESRVIGLIEINNNNSSFSFRVFYDGGAIVVSSPSVPHQLFPYFASYFAQIYEKLPSFFGALPQPDVEDIKGVSISTEIEDDYLTGKESR